MRARRRVHKNRSLPRGQRRRSVDQSRCRGVAMFALAAVVSTAGCGVSLCVACLAFVCAVCAGCSSHWRGMCREPPRAAMFFEGSNSQ